MSMDARWKVYVQDRRFDDNQISNMYLKLKWETVGRFSFDFRPMDGDESYMVANNTLRIFWGDLHKLDGVIQRVDWDSTQWCYHIYGADIRGLLLERVNATPATVHSYTSDIQTNVMFTGCNFPTNIWTGAGENIGKYTFKYHIGIQNTIRITSPTIRWDYVVERGTVYDHVNGCLYDATKNWVPQEYAGATLRFVSGACKNNVYNINGNTANKVCIRLPGEPASLYQMGDATTVSLKWATCFPTAFCACLTGTTSVVVIGSDRGVYLSDDGGTSWATQCSTLPDGVAFSKIVNCGNDIICGITGNAVYRSADAGVTWSNVYTATSVLYPAGVGTNITLYDIAAYESVVQVTGRYIVYGGGIVAESSDLGASWSLKWEKYYVDIRTQFNFSVSPTQILASFPARMLTWNGSQYVEGVTIDPRYSEAYCWSDDQLYVAAGGNTVLNIFAVSQSATSVVSNIAPSGTLMGAGPFLNANGTILLGISGNGTYADYTLKTSTTFTDWTGVTTTPATVAALYSGDVWGSTVIIHQKAYLFDTGPIWINQSTGGASGKIPGCSRIGDIYEIVLWKLTQLQPPSIAPATLQQDNHIIQYNNVNDQSDHTTVMTVRGTS